MVKNDKSDIEAKDLQKKLKYPTDEQLFSIPSNRTPRFLGAYTYDKLPEDASSGDIVQIRIPLENGRKLRDGHLNEVKDRDLIIMTKEHGWILYGTENDLNDNVDNTYIICIGSPARITSNPFDMKPKNLRALNTVVRSFANANVIAIKVSTGEIIMNSNDHAVFDRYLKNIK